MWVKNLTHAYTLGKHFPIVFFSLRYWTGQYVSSCFKHPAPLKHFDCLLYWIELHNAVFQMLSFSLALYNSRINSLLHTACPYVHGFYFCSTSSSCFPSTISPSMFWICVVVYIWDNHTWNQKYLLYLKNIFLDAIPNFGTWHIKLNRKNAGLGRGKNPPDVISRGNVCFHPMESIFLFYYLLNRTATEI